MEYAYQSEKLSLARHNLMIPHPRGVEESIVGAFMECHLAFHRMDEKGLDDNARKWVAKIKGFMSADGIVGEPNEGTWAAKAATLSTDQQMELSDAVDELAHWFDRKFWED
jgi:hypothetical protein